MITRRQLMQNAALLAAGGVSESVDAAKAPHPVRRPDKCVGDRSRSLRYFPWRAGTGQKDWLRRLRDRVSQLEAAIQVSRGGPQQHREKRPYILRHPHLSSLERKDPATHLPPVALYEEVARGGVALGAQRLIFSGAPAANTDDLKRKIAGLNAAGAFSKSLGLPLAYHSHWWEFQSKVDEIKALYAETDPALVSFLLDAGHAYRGGADVPAFLRKQHDRIIALHLRDYRDGKQVPLGEGTFPLADVAATLKHLNWKGWVLNEEEREDGSKQGLSVMEPAFQALQKAFPQ